MNLQISMPSGDPADFLRRKSGVHKSRLSAARASDILLIDDSAFDAKALGALVRAAFGRDAQIRHATGLMRGRNMLLERMPDLILLDDMLPPSDRAEGSIAYLRTCGYAGPIVVVSGQMTRIRRLGLLQVGAADVLHKDDLNVASLAQAAIPASDRALDAPSAVANAADDDEPDDAVSGDEVI